MNKLNKYVVVSLHGQNGDWYKGFETKEEAEAERDTEHYEFGTRYLLTLDEFLDEYSDDKGEDYEWNDDLETFIHFDQYPQVYKF